MSDPTDPGAPAPEDVPTEEPPSDDSQTTDVDTVVSEVLAGYWGRGNQRKAKLEAAGFDPKAVNDAVQKRLTGS